MRHRRRKPRTGGAVGAELLLGLSVRVSLGSLSIRLLLFKTRDYTTPPRHNPRTNCDCNYEPKTAQATASASGDTMRRTALGGPWIA